MTTMKNSIHDNANGLDYTLVNDHYAGSRGRDRSPESCRSTGVGAPDEQHPQPCRRNRQG